jgi:ribosomal protein S1
VPDTIVHGVVLNADRAIAVVQIGDYRAALTARDIAWTRKTNVAEALPRGAIVPWS